jgi:hypothetical protein
MNNVAAYHIFVCALFLVHGGMWAMLPDDDTRCAIETCRSSESVLTFRRRNFLLNFSKSCI